MQAKLSCFVDACLAVWLDACACAGVPLNHICWEAGQWHGRMGHGQQEHRPASACHWTCTVVHWGTARVKKAGGLVRVVKAWVKAKGRGLICCVVCLLHSVAHRVKTCSLFPGNHEILCQLHEQHSPSNRVLGDAKVSFLWSFVGERDVSFCIAVADGPCIVAVGQSRDSL